MLFWALLASGQIIRKVDSWQSLCEKPSNLAINLAARIVLAQEFAFVRATEVTLTRKVVNV
jgi:hypothetical protein